MYTNGMYNLPLMLGAIGATLILGLFILNDFGKLRHTNLKYDVGNFIGAALLLVYAWSLESTPFIVINAIWAVVSLRDIWKCYVGKRKELRKLL